MKSLTEHLWFEVKGRRGFVNITDTIEELVLRSGVNEGLCLCKAMQITNRQGLIRLNSTCTIEIRQAA